jgi:ribonuclease VapC
VDAPAIVFDAQALLAFIDGDPSAEAVRAILADAAAGRRSVLMSVVNVAETMYVVERRGGAHASTAMLDLIQQLPIELVNVDLELAARAAYFKARGGISLGDCFAAALAHRESIPVLTADPEFKQVADLVTIAWLAQSA